MCMKVKRKWRDLFGNGIQCPKLRATCAPIKTYGTPYCRAFGNDTILIHLYKNQRIPYKVSRTKSVKILNGFLGWRNIEHKSELRLKW